MATMKAVSFCFESSSEVGTNGRILHTSDDGSTWTDSSSNAAFGTITAVHFPNADTGYFCTTGGKIYKINKSGITDMSPALTVFVNLGMVIVIWAGGLEAIGRG